MPSRSPFTTEGRAALLHAITHIEFNAINLALDAVWRFAGMPVEFYRDWLQVASEEALHFTLLREHLQTLGADYGSFDAHDGLWLMTERTAHDIASDGRPNARAARASYAAACASRTCCCQNRVNSSR